MKELLAAPLLGENIALASLATLQEERQLRCCRQLGEFALPGFTIVGTESWQALIRRVQWLCEGLQTLAI